MSIPEKHLAVLGSPIEHSRSPQLHRAAYGVLGLPWSYERCDVPTGTLSTFLGSLDHSWRGVSLTMPLKREVLPMLTSQTSLVDSSGVANTVLLEGDQLLGFNTDVAGIVGALADHHITDVDIAHVIGTGATAASAFLAAARLGASRVVISGRSLEGIAALEVLGDRLGVHTEWRLYGSAMPMRADLVINTLPGDVDPDDVPEADLGSVLLEVPYDPWPTPRAARWGVRDALVVNGLEMLLHQAIAQVRIFVTGQEDGELDDEQDVIAAMRESVGLQVEGPAG
ncbi:MAG: shikimate dehydrogenase [Pseudolysinimonas sp.]